MILKFQLCVKLICFLKAYFLFDLICLMVLFIQRTVEGFFFVLFCFVFEEHTSKVGENFTFH